MHPFKVHNPVVFSVVTELWAHHHWCQNICITPRRHPVPKPTSSHSLSSSLPTPVLESHSSTSCLCRWASSRPFLWVESYTKSSASGSFHGTMFSRSSVLQCVSVLHCFVGLSNISWSRQTTFFIHSSVDGHVGYFHFLTTINNSAMNIIFIVLPSWKTAWYLGVKGVGR